MELFGQVIVAWLEVADTVALSQPGHQAKEASRVQCLILRGCLHRRFRPVLRVVPPEPGAVASVRQGICVHRHVAPRFAFPLQGGTHKRQATRIVTADHRPSGRQRVRHETGIVFKLAPVLHPDGGQVLPEQARERDAKQRINELGCRPSQRAQDGLAPARIPGKDQQEEAAVIADAQRAQVVEREKGQAKPEPATQLTRAERRVEGDGKANQKQEGMGDVEDDRHGVKLP